MTFMKLMFFIFTIFIEQQIFITMIRSSLIKLLICFSPSHYSKKKQQEKSQTISSPLKISMLRKVRCRIQSRTSNSNLMTFPLSMVASKQQPITNFLNESQNCAEKLLHHPSLIDIDITNNEYSEEQVSHESMKRSMNVYSRKHDIKSKNGIQLHW